MSFTRLIPSIFLLMLVGCAKSPMTIAPNQELPTVQSDESQVVFMRTSHFGGAISAALFDVTESETDYIGIIAVGTKIAIKTTPGEHLFMVTSEAADFLQATLEAGKTYYAMVTPRIGAWSAQTPRIGAWSARFSLWPMSSEADAKFKNNGPVFDKSVAGTRLLIQSKKSLEWYAKNKGSVEKKKLEYLPVWGKKTEEALRQRSLKPADGL